MANERALRIQWRDPTGETAIHEAGETISILDYTPVDPLDKFNRPKDHKGRRSLLKALNRQLSQTPKIEGKARRNIVQDVKKLEQMQFISRVTPQEVVEAVQDKRLRF